MKNLLVLLALGASMLACETRGVIESHYDTSAGRHISLQQYKDQDRFYYSLSARRPARACDVAELKVVAMGADGKVRLRFEHAPGQTCQPT